MIELVHIKKSFGDNHVISDLSLQVDDGEHMAIMGESGKGKTTLLRIIANLEGIDDGVIRGYSTKDISYVFQESRLFQNLNALDNVACVSDLSRSEARKKASTLLAKVGLSGYEHLYPDELSGGMAQRVSIARAMMNDSPILLLDEPFSALDKATRLEMIRLIKAYVEKKTLILVTHNSEDAELLTSRTVLINDTF